MKSFLKYTLAGWLFVLVLSSVACRQQRDLSYELSVVAESGELWTGVAVSKGGRIFVNYPRWTMAETTSVAELIRSNERRPFPDERWNVWDPTLSPREHFVCVQSVYVDDEDNLWILDPANAEFRGVVPGGAKLVKVNLRSDQVTQMIPFDSSIAPSASYLNDVRVDTRTRFAYITDSGLGAIIVVDLRTGRARRVLHSHHSTKAEDTTFVVEGITLRAKINSDGLALDPSREYLYYQALTSHSLYRIKTAWLQDFSLSDLQLGEKVEFVAKTGIADGLEFDRDGNLYLTSLEYNAIRRYTPAGNIEIVVQDSALKWPDSFSITAEGEIYVTTSQLHLGSGRTQPYQIFKLQEMD
jgi:sugar lactone lactonase YvrE